MTLTDLLDRRTDRRYVYQFEWFHGQCDRCRTVTVRLPLLANTISTDVPAGG